MAHVSFPVDENRWPRARNGNLDRRVVWNASDGPSRTTQWRIIVGSFSGGADYYRGPWQIGDAGNQSSTLSNINLTTPPSPGYMCHIRAQYYIPGNSMMQNGPTSQFYYYP